jgi:hypothetical protein
MKGLVSQAFTEDLYCSGWVSSGNIKQIIYSNSEECNGVLVKVWNGTEFLYKLSDPVFWWLQVYIGPLFLSVSTSLNAETCNALANVQLLISDLLAAMHTSAWPRCWSSCCYPARKDLQQKSGEEGLIDDMWLLLYGSILSALESAGCHTEWVAGKVVRRDICYWSHASETHLHAMPSVK